MAADQGTGQGPQVATQFWDTANHRTLSESAALTLMTPYAHQLLSRARDESRTLPASTVSAQVQKLSKIEVRQDQGNWLSALLARVDQRSLTAGQAPLSAQVATASGGSSTVPRTTTKRPVGKTPTPTRRSATAPPLEGAICPSCFTQMSLTGMCDQCG